MEEYVFSDYLFVLAGQPDQEARFAFLISGSDVNSGFATGKQFSLAFDFSCLFKHSAMSTESFEVFERGAAIGV